MAKQKKKRNKAYRGENASVTRPTVTKITAANRNKAQQWWHEKKRLAKPVLIAAAVALVLSWLLFELFGLLFGA